jgi:hypothetical protein
VTREDRHILSVTFTCDGCGKETNAVQIEPLEGVIVPVPDGWKSGSFPRIGHRTFFDVCSKECYLKVCDEQWSQM